MICFLLSSIYATSALPSETNTGFFGKLRSTASSVCSYLPSKQTAMKAAAVGCTALYFMQDTIPTQSHRTSFLPSLNGTSTQAAVPYLGDYFFGDNFNQIACLAMTGLIGSFTGMTSQLLMAASCFSIRAEAQNCPDFNPQYSCATYNDALDGSGPVGIEILEGILCNTSYLSLAEKSLTSFDMVITRDAIGCLPCLNRIYLGSNEIGDAGFATLYLKFFGSTPPCRTVWSGQVQTLDVSNNSITYSGMEIFFSPGNIKFPALILNMSSNNIGDRGAQTFIRFLQSFFMCTATLTNVFDVRNNNISPNTCSNLTAAFAALKCPSSTTVLC